MAELVYANDLKSFSFGIVGSNPTRGTSCNYYSRICSTYALILRNGLSGFTLTTKQSTKLEEVVAIFYERAVERGCFDGPFLLLLNSVKGAIIERQAVEQFQIDVLVWLIECVIEQFEEKDIDPQLEQCYHKLTGYWFEDIEPWYQRIKDLDNDLVQP